MTRASSRNDKPRDIGRRRALVLALAAVAAGASACVSKPTMRLRYAEITGVRIAFPPSLGILMTVVVDVHNPNVYDVAVRAVRGQVVLARMHALPVDFRAPEGGIWLPAERTTRVGVPVNLPVQLAVELVRTSLSTGVIPYHFRGRADVTATRTFELEKDDYSVSEGGAITRAQMEAALRGPF